jgi:hypothetical protein
VSALLLGHVAEDIRNWTVRLKTCLLASIMPRYDLFRLDDGSLLWVAAAQTMADVHAQNESTCRLPRVCSADWDGLLLVHVRRLAFGGIGAQPTTGYEALSSSDYSPLSLKKVCPRRSLLTASNKRSSTSGFITNPRPPAS